MWLLLAFGSAFFNSLRDLFSKKSVFTIDEYAVAWSQRFFASLFLLPFVIYFFPKTIDGHFWLALAVAALINTITSIWYMKALKISSLSLVAPITSLTPIFILLFSKLTIGEFPNALGVLGIVITVIGTYFLQISKFKEGFMAPLVSIFKDKGVLLMLGVAVLWGISSGYDKIGVQSSNAFFYTGLANIVYTLTLLPFVLSKGRLKIIFRNSKSLLPIGFGQAAAVLLQMMALPLTYVSYVVSVKHTSSLFGVLWGKTIFKEENIAERLLGTVIILLGVVLIIFS